VNRKTKDWVNAGGGWDSPGYEFLTSSQNFHAAFDCWRLNESTRVFYKESKSLAGGIKAATSEASSQSLK
jgi:hypothetical protein